MGWYAMVKLKDSLRYNGLLIGGEIHIVSVADFLAFLNVSITELFSMRSLGQELSQLLGHMPRHLGFGLCGLKGLELGLASTRPLGACCCSLYLRRSHCRRSFQPLPPAPQSLLVPHPVLVALHPVLLILPAGGASSVDGAPNIDGAAPSVDGTVHVPSAGAVVAAGWSRGASSVDGATCNYWWCCTCTPCPCNRCMFNAIAFI